MVGSAFDRHNVLAKRTISLNFTLSEDFIVQFSFAKMSQFFYEEKF